MKILSIVLGIVLAASAGEHHPVKDSRLRLFLSEVRPGALASEHYCMLVFDDHRFHAEKAHRGNGGKDQVRKVYEGELSDSDWNALTAMLDAKQFRELQVPASVPAIVVRDAHPYTISVARQSGFQNMEFLTKESLKPYESELKPLLQWWKSWRGAPMREGEAPPDSRCALSNANGVFNN